MTEQTYPRELVDGGWNMRAPGAAAAARAALPGLRVRVRASGDDVVVAVEEELTAQQIAELAAAMAAYKATVDTLEPLRRRLLLMVDGNTRQLIAQGFEYPAGSGQMFSQSDVAQTNFNTLTAMGAAVPYPIPMQFKDDDGQLVLQDATELAAWGAVGVSRVLTIRLQGGQLKQALRAMTTRAELAAFKDTRL